MNRGPELSIVIPTRNRAETAAYAVRNALGVGNCDSVEVIVHDCGDDDSLGDILEKKGLGRAKYFHVPACSMTENWNLAMEHVHGQYVNFLGDDDCIHPEAAEVVVWAKENGYKSVKCTTPASYNWPDVENAERRGRYTCRSFSGKVLPTMGQDTLRRYLHWPRIGGFHLIPSVYYGLVSMGCMHEVKDRTGLFFDSTNPDYYVGFMLAILGVSHAVIDFPLVVTGTSRKSNSNCVSPRGWKRSKHLDDYPNDAIPSFIPRTSLITEATVLAEPLWKAYYNSGVERILEDKIDLPRLYAHIITTRVGFLESPQLVKQYLSLHGKPERKMGVVRLGRKLLSEFLGRVRLILAKYLRTSRKEKQILFTIRANDILEGLRTMQNYTSKVNTPWRNE